MDKKKYKLTKDEIICKGINAGKTLFNIGILALLCLIAFLVAKYIVHIGIDERPIDTSHRI